MYYIYGIYKSGKRTFIRSLAHTCNIWTGCDIFMYLILMKAQQERAFLCLLLQLRRTAQRRQFVVRSLYPPPPPQTIRIMMRVCSEDCWERESAVMQVIIGKISNQQRNSPPKTLTSLSNRTRWG